MLKKTGFFRCLIGTIGKVTAMCHPSDVVGHMVGEAPLGHSSEVAVRKRAFKSPVGLMSAKNVGFQKGQISRLERAILAGAVVQHPTVHHFHMDI